MGVFIVQLSGGEPFVRKDFVEICKKFSKNGISLMINTNGVLLTDKILTSLKKLNIKSFQISVDSLSKSKLETMRGRTGIYATILSNTKNSKKAFGKSFCVGCVITRFNKEDVLQLAEYTQKLDYRLILIPLLTTGKANDTQDLSIQEKIDLVSSIQRFDNVMVVLPLIYQKMLKLKNKYGYCSFPYHLAIMPNGDVYPCSGLRHKPELKVGNIQSASIKEIYNQSKIMQKLRKIDSASLIGVCAKCKLSAECGGGCRASAYIQYNSFHMPDPLCQKLYEQGLFPKKYLTN